MTDSTRRHSWNATDPKRIPACESIDGNGRTERPCPACGLIKITVHGGDNTHWREWRTKEGKVFTMESTPPCVETKAELQVASENATEVVFS